MKFNKNFLGVQIWGKQAKIDPKISFFAIFLSFVHSFSFQYRRIIGWNNILLLVEVKLTK